MSEKHFAAGASRFAFSRNGLAVSILAAGITVTLALGAARAADVARSYSYFSVSGRTLDEIDEQLQTRGPTVGAAKTRHPGATEMEFSHRIAFGDKRGKCHVASAKVSVKARIILPRWTGRKGAERETRLIWDTLSADIKRHEESHVSIARNHAREMEQALLALPPQKSCDLVTEKATEAVTRIMARHDAEQARFDRIESKNFVKRMERLMLYRMQQIDAGRLPG